MALAGSALFVAAQASAGNRLRPSRVDSGLPSNGQWRNGFDIADVNDDGLADLVHGPRRRGRSRPVVFLGDGEGRFLPWKEARFPKIDLVYGDVATGDFDGDGRIDLAFAVHAVGLAVFLGDGRGGFSDGGQGLPFHEHIRAFSSRSLETADWDGDGRLDLVALGEGALGLTHSRGVSIFSRSTEGAWHQASLALPRDGFGDSLAVGDWNGDGRPDVAIGLRRESPRAVIRVQTDEGELSPVVVKGMPENAFFAAVAAIPGEPTSSVALAYRQRTGSEWASGIHIAAFSPTAGWEAHNILRGVSEEISALASCNLDGSKPRDLIAGTGDGEILVLQALSNGSFRRVRSRELRRAGGGCKAYGIECTDLDDDGVDELVVGFAGESDSGCATGGSLQVWTFGHQGRGVR